MGINNWWEADPAERYWMEITDRQDLGDDLRIPKVDAAGGQTWSYTLTSYVQPGDRIFHWHKSLVGEPAMIGWSEAAGPLEEITMSWQAKGTRGRARGVPTVGPAWRMPLRNFTLLEAPLTRKIISARRAEILAILEEVAARVGRPTYAPFQNYGGRELRAQQGYLTKFPAALVDALFEMPQIGGEASSAAFEKQHVRAHRSQGYQANAAVRAKLEQHSVQKAISHYIGAGATEIEELGKPYDLRVVLDGVERHVEVKGTVGLGVESVQLTQGEVDHARSWQPTDLLVVDAIRVSSGEDGTVHAEGGNLRVWSDWVPEDFSLRPTHLRYMLPCSTSSD